MRLKKVRKLFKELIEKHLCNVGDDEYTYILTEFADGTFQLKYEHSFEKNNKIRINTPYSIKLKQRMIVIEIFNYQTMKNKFYYNTGIKLGREITK